MSSPPTSVLKGQTALPSDKVQQIGLLNAVNDKYGGVVVDMKEPMDSHIYVPLLRASISQWRQQVNKLRTSFSKRSWLVTKKTLRVNCIMFNLFSFFLKGKKGVWIKLPIQQANLVEPTVKVNHKFKVACL